MRMLQKKMKIIIRTCDSYLHVSKLFESRFRWDNILNIFEIRYVRINVWKSNVRFSITLQTNIDVLISTYKWSWRHRILYKNFRSFDLSDFVRSIRNFLDRKSTICTSSFFSSIFRFSYQFSSSFSLFAWYYL